MPGVGPDAEQCLANARAVPGPRRKLERFKDFRPVKRIQPGEVAQSAANGLGDGLIEVRFRLIASLRD
jgi:precorrin-6B methylase 1